MKKNRKSVIAVAVLLVLVIGAFLAWNFLKPSAAEGEKNIRMVVVHADESQRSFDVRTTADSLGAVLRDEGIASGEEGPYGLYIHEADGETADESQQQWWCITKGGETLMTGADDTVISDGEQYELTLKTGW